MINKAFFSITDEDVIKYIQNDFIFPNYQTYLAPANAMYVIDDSRVYLSEFMTTQANIHATLDSKLNISRYNQYHILRLTTDDLSALMRWILDGTLYNGISNESDQPLDTKQVVDSRMCENLLELMKNGATIFYREYDSDIYEESDSEPLKDKLLRYIAIDTRVSTSDSTPSSVGQTMLLEMLYDEATELGYTCSLIDHNTMGTLISIPSNTAKDIPKIGFVAHVDSHNLYDNTPSPEIIKLLDQYYVSSGVNLFDKPYTQSELDSWYKEGVIISSKGGLGINGKAGVVELMGLLEYLKAHPDIPHGEIAIYFCSDAELNRAMNGIQNISGFMDCKMVFFVDGEGLNGINYSNEATYIIDFHFTGSVISTSRNKSAIRNACEFIKELTSDSNSERINNVSIKSLNGDISSATLKLEVKDLIDDNASDSIQEIIRILNNMTKFSAASVTYTNTKLYGNIYSKIPASMISLASEANCNIFNRSMTTTVLKNAANVTDLVSKGIPAITLSNGVYNPYLETECIPIPSLTTCRNVLVEIIRLSYDSSFTDIIS